MSLPTLPEHVYVQAVFSRSRDNAVTNTFCFRKDGTNQGSSLAEESVRESLRDTLDDFYGTGSSDADTVGGNFSLQVHNLRYVMYDLATPQGAAFELPSLTFRDSTTVHTCMPPDVALVLTWRTAMRGRSYRGRTYIGPLAPGTHDGEGRPASGGIDRAGNAGLKLIQNGAGQGWSLAVLSRLLGQANDVFSLDIDNEYDTQRRRGFRSNVRTHFEP